jgi:hypothetical protein
MTTGDCELKNRLRGLWWKRETANGRVDITLHANPASPACASRGAGGRSVLVELVMVRRCGILGDGTTAADT